MKPLSLLALAMSLLLLMPCRVTSKPRPAFPNLPEGELGSWRFNGTVPDFPAVSTNVAVSESWSDYSLVMYGQGPSLFAIPEYSGLKRPSLSRAEGTIRFWFSPAWTSAQLGGTGPRAEARLLTFGSWPVGRGDGDCTFTVSPDGSEICFRYRGQPLVKQSIEWQEQSWHQVAIGWSANATVLYVDGSLAAVGLGTTLDASTNVYPKLALCIGSDLAGGRLAQGQFEEVYSFGRICPEDQIAADYAANAPLAALGPISGEEEQQRLLNAVAQHATKSSVAATPVFRSFQLQNSSELSGGCAAQLTISQSGCNVNLSIINGSTGMSYDLFRTFAFVGDSTASTVWHWLASGTNGQSFTYPMAPFPRAYYILGCDQDSDGDGLTDAYELLVSKTSPTNVYSVNSLYTDAQMLGAQVNSLEEDGGNEQDTQFESTCAVLNGNVIVAYVDSNKGVYLFGGEDLYLTNRVPRFAGYAVSTNGGASFQDQDVPPVARANQATNYQGDAGDPCLAVDNASQTVYLSGTSPRNLGNSGIPFWTSTNGGLTFGNPIIIHNEVTNTDKPWIAVDNAPDYGTNIGQHDVYCAFTAKPAGTGKNIYFAASTNGSGGGWTNPVQIISTNAGANSPIIVPASDHTVYLFWFDRVNTTNQLRMVPVKNRGQNLENASTVKTLVSTNASNGNLLLTRSDDGDTNDYFGAFTFPVPAVNPTNSACLYVVYPDKGTGADKADIFMVQSTNCGTTWTSPITVNTVSTNDQWMPAVTVKPDGTQLLITWYDRRRDTNNSLIDVYGRWGWITNGVVSFPSNDFRITSTSFPPVYGGTLGANFSDGYYDPAYPPGSPNVGAVNLNWWYPEWPLFDEELGSSPLAANIYKSHVGEYNGACSDTNYAYVTWTDNRVLSSSVLFGRYQRDIRLLKLPWPP